MLPEFLRNVGMKDLGAVAPEDTLFPLAVETPGSQHIIDRAIKETLALLPWFPSWERQAKHVLQFLKPVMMRHKFQSIIRRGPLSHAERHALITSLDSALESYAQWRWRTLERACRSLLRVEAAVRYAASIAHPSELRMKDRTGSSDVWAIAGSTLLWDRCRALQHVVQPVNHLSGWIRGCEARGANCPEGAVGKEAAAPLSLHAFRARVQS